MRLALIFDKQRPDTTGGYFERACRRLGLACDHWQLCDAERIPADYALYLRIDHGDDYAVRLPARLRPAVFYAIDTHLAHSWRKIRAAAGWYDLVFCAQRAAARRLPGAEWLPLASDEDLHSTAGRAPEWDVAFIGTDGGVPRKFYLQVLRERYPKHYIGAAEHTALGSIYSRARIGFNYAIANDVNMRVFEVLAAGTLLVTNALPHDDLEALGLQDGRHLALYRSPQELFATIDRFLAQEDARRVIAQAGCELVRAHHTYTHRVRHLLARVSERLGVAVHDAVRSPSVAGVRHKGD